MAITTSSLDIPCSLLDIQKQSRGGAEGAEVEHIGDSFLPAIMRIAGLLLPISGYC